MGFGSDPLILGLLWPPLVGRTSRVYHIYSPIFFLLRTLIWIIVPLFEQRSLTHVADDAVEDSSILLYDWSCLRSTPFDIYTYSCYLPLGFSFTTQFWGFFLRTSVQLWRVFIAHSYPASSSQTHPRVWFWRFSAPAWLALGLYVPSSCLASCHRVIQDGGCRAEVTGRRWKMLFSSFSSRETSRSGHWRDQYPHTNGQKPKESKFW